MCPSLMHRNRHVSHSLQDRLNFAVLAAREAATLILRYYQHADLAVELKGDQSPVTAADRGAEQLLRMLIAEAFPHDGILGEEFGEQAERRDSAGSSTRSTAPSRSSTACRCSER